MMKALYNGGAGLYGISVKSLFFDESSMDAMPLERARKIRSCRFADDKKRSYAAGLLLEAALGKEAAFRAREDAFGKPFLDGGPHFSLSHSGDWAVIAVCEAPVGFDIEFCATGRDIAGIARRAFHPSERGAALDDSGFYRIWTAKESYLKMRGSGLAGMQDFCVKFEGCIGAVDGCPDIAIRSFGHIPGYAAAVCSSAGITWPRSITEISDIRPRQFGRYTGLADTVSKGT
jgi:4'-phosphopantetheinyl transferase